FHRGRDRCRRCRARAKRQRDGESRAPSDFAFNLDLSTHGLNKTRHDGETKPGALYMSTRFAVQAFKLAEDAFGLVYRNAGSRVTHLQNEVEALSRGLGFGRNGDIALLCKLHRIADDVEQDLLNAVRIALEPDARRERQHSAEAQTLVTRPSRHHVANG